MRQRLELLGVACLDRLLTRRLRVLERHLRLHVLAGGRLFLLHLALIFPGCDPESTCEPTQCL